MPYSLQDFKKLGIYHEKPPEATGDIDLDGGKIARNLDQELRDLLKQPRHNGNEDASGKDYGLIRKLIEHGLSLPDIYTTFINSPRGKAAIADHSDAWVRTTIMKANGKRKTDPVFEEPKEDTDPQVPPLRVRSADQLLKAKFRPRPPLMSTGKDVAVFRTASINEIHAWRGVGKTQVALGLAKALAAKVPFLGWHPTQSWRVLYVDGELPAEDFQSRVELLIGDHQPNFLCVTCEDQPEYRIHPISTEVGRTLIENEIKRLKVQVLFLDAISTLANIATNEEKEWLAISEWFRYLRSRYGIAIFYLHHDGKGGQQRGHSKHEDPADKVVHLTWEGAYKGAEGLRCVLEFEKSREPLGNGPSARRLWLKGGEFEWEAKVGGKESKPGRKSVIDKKLGEEIQRLVKEIEATDEPATGQRVYDGIAKFCEGNDVKLPSKRTVERHLAGLGD